MTLSKVKLAQARWLQAPASQRLMRILAEAGHPSRFAGGCVRDALVGSATSTTDVDIATTALPTQVLELAIEHGLRALPTGLTHGTVTVLIEDRSFEVTTLRRDMETDGRHAVVEFTDDFAIDAARRDLTINALSCDAAGQVFDYFGGIEDLAAGRIRFVGEAGARIAEDYLRILRYFRFYARFGRVPPDAATKSALAAGVRGLSRISGERLQKELRLLLVACGRGQAIRMMAQLGANLELFGTNGNLDAFELAQPESPWLASLAILLRDRVDANAVARRLKLSAKDAECFFGLMNDPLPTSDAPDRLLALYAVKDLDYTTALYHVARATDAQIDLDKVMTTLSRTSRPVLPIAGRDIVAMGEAPGPRIGEILVQVKAAWLAGGCLMDRPTALAMAKRLHEAELTEK